MKFTYESSVEFLTNLELPMYAYTIACFAFVLLYVLRLGDVDFKESLLRTQLDADRAHFAVVFEQGVVYWQAAIVRLTEDLDGLSKDCPADHRDLWSGDKN